MCERSLQRGSDDLNDFKPRLSGAYQDAHCLCHCSTNVHLHMLFHAHNLTHWSTPPTFFFRCLTTATQQPEQQY